MREIILLSALKILGFRFLDGNMLSSAFTIHEGLNDVLNLCLLLLSLAVASGNMTGTLETEDSITVCPIFLTEYYVHIYTHCQKLMKSVSCHGS